MWWYDILGDNKGSISHLLRIYTTTSGFVLITTSLVALKMENPEPILIVNRTEWSKSIDYSGLSIEAYPSRVGRKNIYFVHIGYITSPLSINLHISRQHMCK